MNKTGGFPLSLDLSKINLETLREQFPIILRSHSRRVAVCASIMAEYADDSIQRRYYNTKTNVAFLAHLGGTLHDVGKLLLPAIEVSEEDYLRHPIIGAEFLEEHKKTLFDYQIEAPIVIDIVLHHHEQPDGNGFPNGMHMKAIQLLASVCNIANTLDHELYEANSGSDGIKDDVYGKIKAQAGSMFCKGAVIYFERAWPRLKKEYIKWNHVF